MIYAFLKVNQSINQLWNKNEEPGEQLEESSAAITAPPTPPGHQVNVGLHPISQPVWFMLMFGQHSWVGDSSTVSLAASTLS